MIHAQYKLVWIGQHRLFPNEDERAIHFQSPLPSSIDPIVPSELSWADSAWRRRPPTSSIASSRALSFYQKKNNKRIY
jgi:hypothetical protein